MGERVLFLGMGGEFSRTVLEGLVQGGVDVMAVVFPRLWMDDNSPRWMPPPAQSSGEMELVMKPLREDIFVIAGRQGIPVLEVGSMGNLETLEILRELETDLAVTACFPQILPEAFLQVPRLGCLNIHPSLLPAYRGPEPLFWQFRAGEVNTGVTVHWMDEGVDTGDVLNSRSLQYPEGIRTIDAERCAAQIGAEMIVDAFKRNEYARTPQHEHGASYQGIPKNEDKVIGIGWETRRAFNFMRGANIFTPFWIELGEAEKLEVRDALGYELGAKIEQQVIEKDGKKHVQMRDGVLIVR